MSSIVSSSVNFFSSFSRASASLSRREVEGSSLVVSIGEVATLLLVRDSDLPPVTGRTVRVLTGDPSARSVMRRGAMRLALGTVDVVVAAAATAAERGKDLPATLSSQGGLALIFLRLRRGILPEMLGAVLVRRTWAAALFCARCWASTIYLDDGILFVPL